MTVGQASAQIAAEAGDGPVGAKVQQLVFANGNRAVAVIARPRETAIVLASALDLGAPHPVLVVVGGADSMDQATKPHVRRLFERGVGPALEMTGGTIVDGGTASGVMATAGEAIAAGGSSVSLVGVAPAGRVTYPGDQRDPKAVAAAAELEPNHSHFILANSDEWGGETRLMFEVVEALAGSCPVTVLVAGGGPGTFDELLEATARGWPIVVLAGTGGIADRLASAAEARRLAPDGSLGDPVVEPVIDQAFLTIVPPDADPVVLERLLARRLQADETLRMAWEQYGTLSQAAKQQQRTFLLLQRTILGLGVLVTLLVVVQVILQRDGRASDGEPLAVVLHYSIVLIPIVIAALIAAAARLRPGSRWVQLRGTAEAIKSEIFRYRTRTGRYAPSRTRVTPREVKLVEAVGSMMRALMQTDVNLSVLDDEGHPGDPAAGHTAGGDDGVRPLTADDYVRYRIDHQILYYHDGVRSRVRHVRSLRWLILAVGGLGTFLAAALLEPWVAVTAAVAGATATYLEAMQLEPTIMLHNRAATDLGTIRAWWMALSPDEQVRPGTIDRLVDRSERIMGAEHSGWVQEMQDAITQLRLEQTDDEPRHESGRDPSTDKADAGTDDKTTGSDPGSIGAGSATERKPRPHDR